MFIRWWISFPYQTTHTFLMILLRMLFRHLTLFWIFFYTMYKAGAVRTYAKMPKTTVPTRSIVKTVSGVFRTCQRNPPKNSLVHVSVQITSTWHIFMLVCRRLLNLNLKIWFDIVEKKHIYRLPSITGRKKCRHEDLATGFLNISRNRNGITIDKITKMSIWFSKDITSRGFMNLYHI